MNKADSPLNMQSHESTADIIGADYWERRTKAVCMPPKSAMQGVIRTSLLLQQQQIQGRLLANMRDAEGWHGNAFAELRAYCRCAFVQNGIGRSMEEQASHSQSLLLPPTQSVIPILNLIPTLPPGCRYRNWPPRLQSSTS